MSSKRRNTKRELSQQRELWKNYGGRIARSGELRPKSEYSRWYCFACENHFYQKTASITDRGSRTRCLCPPNNSQRFDRGGNPKSVGHMCLPEWDQCDLTPPERPSDPQDGA